MKRLGKGCEVLLGVVYYIDCLRYCKSGTRDI